MSAADFGEKMDSLSKQEQIRCHLENVYRIEIEQLTVLDQGVYRVDRYDGPSWIARLFPKARSLENINGDAAILRLLEQQNFPAERCAHPQPVSVLDEEGILVTNFVQGANPKGSPKAYYFLGTLLGRLHTLPEALYSNLRKGGAWHHLTDESGALEETKSAMALLFDSEQSISEKRRPAVDLLLKELNQSIDFDDMPQALIHPDFVPVNMIRSAVADWTVVDWAGAGRGPRISSLGFVLWAAGNRDTLSVDAAIAGYRKYIKLNTDELAILYNAIRHRPIIFETWMFCKGKKGYQEVIRELPHISDRAKLITERAIQAFM